LPARTNRRRPSGFEIRSRPRPAASGTEDRHVFENLDSLSVSGGRRAAGMRLEALEDRTTPAVITAFSSPLAVDTTALSGITLAANAGIDRAFLSEVARVSVVQFFLATTEANQGSDPQIRAFAQQLAASQLDVFNQVLPVLQRSGVPFQLNQIDLALASVLPTLSGTNLDTQFLFFSSLYGLQGLGLAQTEAQLGTNVSVRAFAQATFSPLQTQLQTGFGFLGLNTTTATLNLFSTLSGFGPFSTTLGTTSGVFVGTPTATVFTSTSIGTFGSTPTSGMFGSTPTGGVFGSPPTGLNPGPGTGTFTGPGTGTFTGPGTGTFGTPGPLF
jgi:hypothetical protein